MLSGFNLLIDRDCPMCCLYGRLFVKLDLVDSNTISSYQTSQEKLKGKVDLERARNEIAFHDNQTGKTYYGINAFVKIIAHDKPRLLGFLNSTPIHYILNILYKFISYNRKVIYPVKKGISCNCEPDLSISYRVAYISFVAFITAAILRHFVPPIFGYFNLHYSATTELAVCFGQVVWQAIAIANIDRTRLWEYLGNMSTVSLIGGLLLLPFLLLSNIIVFHPLALLFIFGLIVGVMLLEHIRRCRLLEINVVMTLSWIVFRITALLIILLTSQI